MKVFNLKTTVHNLAIYLFSLLKCSSNIYIVCFLSMVYDNVSVKQYYMYVHDTIYYIYVYMHITAPRMRSRFLRRVLGRS